MGAYQLKITIKGSKPPIWRRLLVPQEITFEELHEMIQTAFCWSSARLYQFEFRSEGIRVVETDEEAGGKFRNISFRESIGSLVSESKKFTYTYGFENNWEHMIQVEKLLEDSSQSWGQVIKYKGGVIPEDCGGIAAYYDLLNSGSDAELPEDYDMETVNERLKAGRASKADDLGAKEVTLMEIYDCYDRNSIAEIAKRHGMNGCLQLEKKELAESVISYILGEMEMRKYFLCVRDTEMQLFEQLIEGDRKIASFEEEDMDYLYAGGYVTADDEHGFLVPYEVEKAYNKFNTAEFQAERARICKIGNYLCAANSLYAVTPESIVLEIFNLYENQKLSEKELLEAYNTLLPYRCIVKYIEGKFIDINLAEQNSYEQLYQKQKPVPYYIPTELEIKFMSDNAGFLMTRELSQLSSFLTNQLMVENERIPYVLRQVQAEISLGGSLQSVIDGLEAIGIVFTTVEQTERFTSIITDVWNHTRMVLNRGYQPYEMVVHRLEPDSGQRDKIKKTYPNDPCPCGSGKKYKKCCGKRS